LKWVLGNLYKEMFKNFEPSQRTPDFFRDKKFVRCWNRVDCNSYKAKTVNYILQKSTPYSKLLKLRASIGWQTLVSDEVSEIWIRCKKFFSLHNWIFNPHRLPQEKMTSNNMTLNKRDLMNCAREKEQWKHFIWKTNIWEKLSFFKKITF
jgi:hypothetical protein